MAAVYEAPNAPFVFRDYPLRPVGLDEVLVRVLMSTICRSDLHSYEGRRPNPTPCILGHEIVGVIEEMGPGIQRDLSGDPLAPGDRITWTEYFADPSYQSEVLDLPQKSASIRKYGHERADVDPHLVGGFAECCYLLPGTGILKVPAELSDEEASPLNCGVATMIAATEAAGIATGDAVVIQGLGLLGLYGVAIARSRAARVVSGIDRVPARLEMAKTFGADLTLDASRLSPDTIRGAVRDACRPDGADAVIEVSGAAEAIPVGLGMLRAGGRYAIAGLVSPGAEVTFDAHLVVRQCLTVRGVHNYHPRHLIQAREFVRREREHFPFRRLVDATFELEDIGLAFRRAANRDVLRAAIVPPSAR
jgi:putative phosphonate catabolism associated alcohol dehydrogenase